MRLLIDGHLGGWVGLSGPHSMRAVLEVSRAIRTSIYDPEKSNQGKLLAEAKIEFNNVNIKTNRISLSVDLGLQWL